MSTSRFVPSWPLLCVLSILCVSAPAQTNPPASAATEPSNAQEAAEKKAAEDKAIADKFAAWKATLSPQQQAWETLLEQNLGGFYLPLYQREKVRGSVSAWDYVPDDPSLPRVLLIGDSVSRGYTLAARKALAGKANVHRAPENCGPTANGLKKLDIWLGDGKWDVIHFNFGIHDRADQAGRLRTAAGDDRHPPESDRGKADLGQHYAHPARYEGRPRRRGGDRREKPYRRKRDGQARRRDRRPVHLHHAAPGEGPEPAGCPLQRRGLRTARQAGRGGDRSRVQVSLH